MRGNYHSRDIGAHQNNRRLLQVGPLKQVFREFQAIHRWKLVVYHEKLRSNLLNHMKRLVCIGGERNLVRRFQKQDLLDDTANGFVILNNENHLNLVPVATRGICLARFFHILTHYFLSFRYPAK